MTPLCNSRSERTRNIISLLVDTSSCLIIYIFFVRGPDDFQLGQWVGMLKQHLAKAIGWTQTSGPLWQRGFFDHLLRTAESYGEKWNYVRENPVRAGLVERAEDWQYAGEIIVIDRV